MKKFRILFIFILAIIIIPFSILTILLAQKHGSFAMAWKDFVQQSTGTNDLSRLVYLPENPCQNSQNQDRGILNPIYIPIPKIEFQSEKSSPNWNPPGQPKGASLALICNEKDEAGNVRAQIEYGFPMNLSQNLSSLDLLIQLLDEEGNVLNRMERNGNLGFHFYKKGDKALVGIILSTGRPIEKKPDKLLITHRGSVQEDIMDHYPTKIPIASIYSKNKFQELEYHSERKKKKGSPNITLKERGAHKGKITYTENERRRSFSSSGNHYTIKQDTYYGIATDWIISNESNSTYESVKIVFEALDANGNMIYSANHRLWTRHHNFQWKPGEKFGFGKLWSMKKDQWEKVQSYRVYVK
ncbi:MAG: hypothetical protein JJT78_15640 [Leptospira sp.]|nr:hypothetical protein [Leptospira sp.]